MCKKSKVFGNWRKKSAKTIGAGEKKAARIVNLRNPVLNPGDIGKDV